MATVEWDYTYWNPYFSLWARFGKLKGSKDVKGLCGLAGTMPNGDHRVSLLWPRKPVPITFLSTPGSGFS